MPPAIFYGMPRTLPVLRRGRAAPHPPARLNAGTALRGGAVPGLAAG